MYIIAYACCNRVTLKLPFVANIMIVLFSSNVQLIIWIPNHLDMDVLMGCALQCNEAASYYDQTALDMTGLGTF